MEIVWEDPGPAPEKADNASKYKAVTEACKANPGKFALVRVAGSKGSASGSAYDFKKRRGLETAIRPCEVDGVTKWKLYVRAPEVQ